MNHYFIPRKIRYETHQTFHYRNVSPSQFVQKDQCKQRIHDYPTLLTIKKLVEGGKRLSVQAQLSRTRNMKLKQRSSHTFCPPSFISTTTMASPSSSPSPSRPMRSMRRTTLTLSHRSNSFQQDRGFHRDDLDSPAFEGSMILASAIAMNKERHLEYFPMPLHITSDAPLGIKSLDDDKNTWRTTEDEKDSNPHWRT